MSQLWKAIKESRLRWAGICVLAVVMLLAFASPSLAAPRTIHGASYEQMKKFMGEFNKCGFDKVVDLGASKTYKATLASLKLEIDPTLSAVAQYDQITKTITFSKDPRKLKPSETAAFGETTWHEVTHAIEDANGDFAVNDSPVYAERNVDYMTYVSRTALPILERMEKKAKAGASVKTLKAYWEKYLKAMEDASKLPVATAYPPDLALMRGWFGFRADTETIKKCYLSGKALPGKQGANLRRALKPTTPSGTPVVIWNNGNVHGVGNGGTSPTVTLAQACYVTQVATYHWNDGRGSSPGTISLKAASGTVYGPWQAICPDGPTYWYVYPEQEIPAGSYTVIDSEPSTWAQNTETGGEGMTWAMGIVE